MNGDDGKPRPSFGPPDRFEQAPTISLDTALELLAPRRRRFVLYTLTDAADGVVSFESLVEDVATLEAAIADGRLARDRYVGVAVDLYRWHLPVLADVGVVEHDERSGTIRYRTHPTLETWSRLLRRDELDCGSESDSG